MKMRKVFIWWFAVVALCLVAALIWRRCLKFKEDQRWRSLMANSEERGRLPQKDVSVWMAEHGSDEPDSTSQAGRARLQVECQQLPERIERFRSLLKGLPVVYTNADPNAAKDYLKEVDHCLDGLSRLSCEEVLKAVGWDCAGWDVDVTLKTLSTEESYALALTRYCLIFGRFADLVWERAGDSYVAAEADRRTFNVLKSCARLFPDWRSVTDACLEEWKQKRCDSENSNFCRSYREREKLFRTYWKPFLEKAPDMKNATMDWRYWHLKWARSALRRDPSWAPGQKD